MAIIKAIFREIIRLYLKSFPLRDGKMFIYHLFNKSLAPSQGSLEVEMRPGFKMKLDLNENSQRMMYFFGNYDERHEITMLQRVLGPGDIFWDVGANVGFYTLMASRLVGNAGLVIAFEPGTDSWRALMDNLNLNRTTNVLPFKMAVSDDYGWVTLYSQEDLADGGASIIPRPGQPFREEVCPAINLDRFHRDLGRKAPTFIKIDVEGAEERVLKGGRQLLAGNSPPLLLVEMNDRQALGTFLQGLGFAGAHLHRRKWYLCQDLARAKSRNMLWFRPDQDWHWDRLRRILSKNNRQGDFPDDQFSKN